LPILLQNILYKTLFTTNFVENTYEFYNFVGNNYSGRNYLPIKILRKNSRKKSFLANFFKFARKFSCNMRIFSSDSREAKKKGIMISYIEVKKVMPA